ncbi:hypothetical protein [Butyrivibrio sp. AC2005]|uniref:hypothetical protein n=1 Tax=Butyrivibrio sp. AC2005 TaxID=1280672 RepID=UPI0003FF056A|nr:hypothetical protein [Butyrivibrio sp. AC2005]
MSKPYLPYGQQIQKLIHDKGLIINDINYAERMLTDIGYFSLIGGYKNLFINPMTRKYVGGTTFEDIITSLSPMSIKSSMLISCKKKGLQKTNPEGLPYYCNTNP